MVGAALGRKLAAVLAYDIIAGLDGIDEVAVLRASAINRVAHDLLQVCQHIVCVLESTHTNVVGVVGGIIQDLLSLLVCTLQKVIGLFSGFPLNSLSVTMLWDLLSGLGNDSVCLD